ncbi:glycoside hydrolase family 43 protein [Parapedobacter tibetensis]|uniref:glycoside hydrolase family 43 protein n=1 Tax=Parapedobacter tibetensis TaxID=2972951 RepID=UPI00214D4574|nr:glycoside hydrolase family 43 protein [Parapedobacter tibetensis]
MKNRITDILSCCKSASGILVLLLGPVMLSSAQTAPGEPPFTPEKSVAYFDYFHYAGKDAYYEAHALPGPEYFYNPVLPGWYSDPSICTNGDDYFLVTSTFSYFPGVPIFHSRDLVNWKQIGHVLDRPSQLELSGQRISEGIFAPAISYNPYNQTYYMITTNIRKGNFYVKTKDPFGPWSDPIWLPDVKGIDPSFFFDDDGRAYILNNDAPDGPPLYEGHRAIRVIEFDVDADRTIGENNMLVNGGVNLAEKPIWIEGPHIYKIKGQYYLMAAEGGTSVQHSEVIFKGDAPMGTFSPWGGNPILTQRHLDPKRPNPITSAGHADLIQTKEGDWWAVFLACRPIDGQFENLGRETFLMPVTWSEDGFPYLTQGEDIIPMVLKRDGVTRDPDSRLGNFPIADDFMSSKLSHDWFTLRTPASELYALDRQRGYLALTPVPVSVRELKTPAFVGRRVHHHSYEATTRLVFDPADGTEAAGILLLKDEKHQYFFGIRRDDGHFVAFLEKTGPDEVEILAEQPLATTGSAFDLKVDSKGTHFDFQVGDGNGGWQAVIDGVDARHLSTANSFGFTGTTIGLYAIKMNKLDERDNR